MCRKFFYLIPFVLLLCVVLTSVVKGADPNLLGWWKLDDGTGNTAFDSSGLDNHGTIYNTSSGLGPGGSVWYNDPEHGMVLSFNGDDSTGAYVDAGTIPAMTAMTMPYRPSRP